VPGGRGSWCYYSVKKPAEVVQKETNRDEENEGRKTRIRSREAGIAYIAKDFSNPLVIDP
jgi:hypothetical protein